MYSRGKKLLACLWGCDKQNKVEYATYRHSEAGSDGGDNKPSEEALRTFPSCFGLSCVKLVGPKLSFQ